MRRALIAGLVPLLLGACSGTLDKINPWSAKGDDRDRPAALVEFAPRAVMTQQWRANIGAAGGAVFTPVHADRAVYAAGANGDLAKFEAASGREVWRVQTGRPLSGGVGVGEGLVLVGTSKGEVLAFDRDGQPRWTARVTSEVLSAPQAGSGIVVVRSVDGRIFGLDAADGKRKWLYQRSLPALSLRSHAGVVVDRGAVFVGFPGGKLVALDLPTGNVGWETSIAQPKGTTELERIADITGQPVLDSRQVYAVAYQGRVGAIDLRSGSSAWSRDISSSAGLSADVRYLFVTDARGAVIALDKATGASVWKQDKLANRQLTAPLAFGRYVLVGDYQGYVHVLGREDGAFVARIATDGSPIRTPPVELDTQVLVQTSLGGIFALGIQ